MWPVRMTTGAGNKQLNVLTIALSLIFGASPGMALANDSTTPSPLPTDPLWPCVGAQPWEYTLWNNDGSVKEGYPQLRDANVACEAPHQVGEWNPMSWYSDYPGCAINETWSSWDALAGVNKIIDYKRAENICIYLKEAARNVVYNYEPVYEYGEVTCNTLEVNAAHIFPHLKTIPKPKYDPENHGMYFKLTGFISPPSEPFCGGKIPTFVGFDPTDYMLAKYACPPGTNILNIPVGEGTCVPLTPPTESTCEDRVGNPVDASSGHKVKSVFDYVGTGGLSFFRTYSSGNIAHGNTQPWGSSIEMAAKILAIKGGNASRYSAFAVVTAGGAQLVYKLQDDNSLTPVAGITNQAKLTLVTQTTAVPNALSMDSIPSGTTLYITGYTLTASDGSFDRFDSQGTIVSSTSASNATRTFTYSGEGNSRRLDSISDFTGRTLKFTYSWSNQLIEMVDPAKGIYRYEYPSSVQSRDESLLNKVTYPDLTSIRYTYVPGTSNLESTIDQKGVVYNSVTYSPVDLTKALSTQLAGGVDGFTFTYSPYGGSYQDPDVLIVDVTDSVNNISHRKYEKINGRRRLVAQDQPAGSGCGAAIAKAAYTTAGRKISKDDFNGVRTCFISTSTDAARDLDTSIIEGLPTTSSCASTLGGYNLTVASGARAITKQWHPDVAVPVKVNSPRFQTQYVYNGRPDPSNAGSLAACMPGTLPSGKLPAVLCKTIENATTDLTGSAGLSAYVDVAVPSRITSFTYNADGQILTVKDPSNATTQFAYYDLTTALHTKGDLFRVINPKGQATTFDSYNAHGDVLQSTAINGLVTNITYDSMRRRLTASAGGLTETYKYTPFGAIERVTAANGTFTQYDYDPAHRLVSVTDASGNVHIQNRNTAGELLDETVQDGQGTIVRRVTRVYDALHRVKQVTGAQ